MESRYVVMVLLGVSLAAWGLTRAAEQENAAPIRLAVVWTSGDPDVAHKMVLMYVHASQKSQWFGEN